MSGVLKISDAASIAMHTMIALAGCPGQVRSTADIAQQLHVSEAHLAKVLQRLHRGRFVQAVRGPRGGFTLACDPACTTLLDVYESIEGPMEETTCLLNLPRCEARECCFSGLLQETTRRLREHLGRTHLSAVAHILRPAAGTKDVRRET